MKHVAPRFIAGVDAQALQVEVPEPALCCGRPLYDYGMLNTARRLLRKILDTLRPQIEQGVPIAQVIQMAMHED